MLVALYELLGSLVESQDIQGLHLAMDMARRITSELETRTTKEFEGSKETLEMLSRDFSPRILMGFR